MIDVVYTLGTESNFNDKELRLSLRSLHNFKELGKVYIVGFKPHWVNPYEVVHIPASDPYKTNKDGNLTNKLILACLDKDLSDQFIWFSDDQVLLNEVSLSVFERPIIDNSHLNFYKQDRLNRWQTRLKRTVDVLRDRQFRTNCYEAHVPYMLDKEKFPKIMFQYDYGEGVGYCGNTLYFNTTSANGIDGVQNLFIRLDKKIETIDQIHNVCSKKLFLNYTDAAINNELFLYLENRFSVKSRYEM